MVKYVSQSFSYLNVFYINLIWHGEVNSDVHVMKENCAFQLLKKQWKWSILKLWIDQWIFFFLTVFQPICHGNSNQEGEALTLCSHPKVKILESERCVGEGRLRATHPDMSLQVAHLWGTTQDFFFISSNTQWLSNITLKIWSFVCTCVWHMCRLVHSYSVLCGFWTYSFLVKINFKVCCKSANCQPWTISRNRLWKRNRKAVSLPLNCRNKWASQFKLTLFFTFGANL